MPSTMVHVRVDEKVKEEASATLWEYLFPTLCA
jgi:antitoxin component of RelBE/YafQ-DinJ toxin-antitoxin module